MNQPARRQRGRPAIPPEVQRKRLVDAALRAFEKSAYEGTTVSDIVREAGMSSRSFYEFFASKEDLVATIVHEQGDRLLEEMSVVARQAATAEDSIARAVDVFLEVFPAATLDLERLGGDAGQRVRDARRHYVQLITDLVVAHYSDMAARGLVERVPDRTAVELMITGIEGMAIRYYSDGRRAALLALRPALTQLLARALL